MKSRKTFSFAIIFVLGILFLQFFSGCDNFFKGSTDFSSEEVFTLKGSLNMTGGVPFVLSNNAGASRTTVPSIPLDLTYSVNAKNGTKNVQAVVTGRSFSIRLTSGTWTLTAKGISNGKKVLEGSSEVTLSPGVFSEPGISIVIKPKSTSGGKGTVALPVSVQEYETSSNMGSLAVGSVKVAWEIDGTQYVEKIDFQNKTSATVASGAVKTKISL